MFKEFIQKIMPYFYINDPWLNAILDGASARTAEEIQRIIDLSNFNNLGQLNGKWLEEYEKLLGITPDPLKDIADRRANVLAHWKSSEKPTKELLQSICDGWQNGAVSLEYDYINGAIVLTFVSEYGTPQGIEELKKAMANVVPAHLKISYDFKYLLINEVHEVMTLAEIESKPLSMFAF